MAVPEHGTHVALTSVAQFEVLSLPGVFSPGLLVSSGGFLQDGIIHDQIRNNLAQPAIFLLQFFQFRTHYEAASAGYYYTIGRFLVGLAGQKEVLRLATDPQKVCEVTYYIGLRAEAEERYEEASDWYRASVETGLSNNGEYKWAFNVLWRWQTSGKDLRRLAADRQNNHPTASADGKN